MPGAHLTTHARVALRLAESLLCLALSANASAQSLVTWQQISDQTVTPPDARIQYGEDERRFGDLRLPPGPGPHPVAVVIHGGCWRSEYDLMHISPLSVALAKAGIATWTIEFRRIGDEGGGWPGTFNDVARGTDYLRTLALKFPLDLGRVVLVGHSAGGHLALWLAARRNLPKTSPLFSDTPLPVRGVVPLAGITDLRRYREGPGGCNAAVERLLGGSPGKFPERYAQTSPIELLPLGVPTRLVQGSIDPIVFVEQAKRFATQASAKGDDAQIVQIDGAGHFDVIAPFAPAWSTIERTILSLIAAH
jgi:acetyl esterase/lipase